MGAIRMELTGLRQLSRKSTVITLTDSHEPGAGSCWREDTRDELVRIALERFG